MREVRKLPERQKKPFYLAKALCGRCRSISEQQNLRSLKWKGYISIKIAEGLSPVSFNQEAEATVGSSQN